jgi:hypothetical protein
MMQTLELRRHLVSAFTYATLSGSDVTVLTPRAVGRVANGATTPDSKTVFLRESRTATRYCTAIVTDGEETAPFWPVIVSTTGTASPVGTPAGICTFTWYSPTKPGAKPAKIT